MVASNVFNTLVTLPEYVAAKRISVYLSMPTGEVSTIPIVHDALDRGKAVFVPYLHKNQNNDNEPSSIMDMLRLHSAKDFGSLQPDKWGIPTLGDSSVAGRENCMGGRGIGDVKSQDDNGGFDLILMPGMGFDRDFGRLGHGKGYYDYFLHRYQEIARNLGTESPHKRHSKPFLSE
jgi:5-formyltetrahydrofolate cyclo-ligase